MRTKCKCGYDFLQQQVHGGVTGFESYALIDDKNYRLFLRSEMKVIRADNEAARLRAIGRSSRYVGSVLECPKCSRLLLFKPGGDSPGGGPILYKREEDSRPPRSEGVSRRRSRIKKPAA